MKYLGLLCMAAAAVVGGFLLAGEWEMRVKIDKTQAGKTVEEIEETDFVSIYLIFRDDLSILPQKDTMLKLNDIIIIRDGN